MTLTSGTHTDQPKIKAPFSHFAPEHPLCEIISFADTNKNHLFRQGFSSRTFAEKLRESLRKNYATFCGDTPRNFVIGR